MTNYIKKNRIALWRKSSSKKRYICQLSLWIFRRNIIVGFYINKKYKYFQVEGGYSQNIDKMSHSEMLEYKTLIFFDSRMITEYKTYKNHNKRSK